LAAKWAQYPPVCITAT